MIKSKVFILLLIFECIVISAFFVHGFLVKHHHQTRVTPDKMALVATLQLTDIAVWTEARYTRHPSQTDFFSAFQDFPGAIDHFPAGSVIAPNTELLGAIK